MGCIGVLLSTTMIHSAAFIVRSSAMRTCDWFGCLAIGTTILATATLGHSALGGTPCATSPGPQTEPGTHWYYHSDPVDHRQCWHVKRLPTASVTPENTSLDFHGTEST
jgi:hypothetical protein